MQDHPKGAGDGPAITTWDEDEREQWALRGVDLGIVEFSSAASPGAGGIAERSIPAGARGEERAAGG